VGGHWQPGSVHISNHLEMILTNTQSTTYSGSAYCGIVGSDAEYGAARDSIEAISRRPGDSAFNHVRATKGYEARQLHINRFLDSPFDFMFLMDSDMVFSPDSLERLRRWGMPYVSGFYMRRNYETLGPVWYRPFVGDQFPMGPWVGEIERGRLHKIGASGWGCILVHRSVILGVRALLKGEWEVLEDDMDIHPYDLIKIMGAINALDKLTAAKITDAVSLQAHIDVLKSEIRPLRCDREIVGSDIRFPFFALQAGYQLWGDPDVAPGHVVNYPLKISDYDAVPRERVGQVKIGQRREVKKQRNRLHAQREAVLNA
jgi:hypothetical protein